MGNKMIPSEALLGMESFYLPWVTVIILIYHNQVVEDSLSYSLIKAYLNLNAHFLLDNFKIVG